MQYEYILCVFVCVNEALVEDGFAFLRTSLFFYVLACRYEIPLYRD